jgi:hypothetical protein
MWSLAPTKIPRVRFLAVCVQFVLDKAVREDVCRGIMISHPHRRARGSVVGWSTMLQAGRSPVRVPNEVDFFNLPNPPSRTMALGSTQPLTKMSTKNLSGVKSGRRVGLTTLLPSVCRMSEHVGASTSRGPKSLHSLYRDNVTFTFTLHPNREYTSHPVPSLSFKHCSTIIHLPHSSSASSHIVAPEPECQKRKSDASESKTLKYNNGIHSFKILCVFD